MLKVFLIIMLVFGASYGDCTKCNELKGKYASELTIGEIEYLKSCTEFCTGNEKPVKKPFNHGKFWLITGIVVITIAVLNAVPTN
jgi:hypothetical protein